MKVCSVSPGGPGAPSGSPAPPRSGPAIPQAASASEDALFTSDGVAARVTMRVDWGVGDPDAFAVIGTPVAREAKGKK